MNQLPKTVACAVDKISQPIDCPFASSCLTVLYSFGLYYFLIIVYVSVRLSLQMFDFDK